MLDFWVNTNIWLHLEDYYNQGVKPEDVKKCIEMICDPFGNNHLMCESSGFNHNWIVQTRATHKNDIQLVVNVIQSELNKLVMQSVK